MSDEGSDEGSRAHGGDANVRCGNRAGVRRPFPAGPLLRGISQISEQCGPPEDIVAVRSARVVIANYRALAHDFPEQFGPSFEHGYAPHICSACRRAGRLCLRAMDAWLLDNAAFVSLQQSVPNNVNSPIAHGPP